MTIQQELGQFFTPGWAAEALMEEFLAGASGNEVFCEPSCGNGAFLNAIPPGFEAFGVEIDPTIAAEAATNTGRQIIVGDFRTVPLPKSPSAIVGNPPFNSATIDGFISRSAIILPDGGRIGFIVPAHLFSFATTVEKWRQTWSMAQSAIPRDLFPRIRYPLAFLTMTKDRRRQLFGFALFDTCNDLKHVGRAYLKVLKGPGRKGSVWRQLCDDALAACGGEATSQLLYELIIPGAPRSNTRPKDKIRQILQEGRDSGRYKHLATGRWALANPPVFALA